MQIKVRQERIFAGRTLTLAKSAFKASQRVARDATQSPIAVVILLILLAMRRQPVNRPTQDQG